MMSRRRTTNGKSGSDCFSSISVFLCLVSISLPSDDLISDGMDVDNVVDGDSPASKDPNDLSEYNLDTYDEEENTLSARKP